MSINELIEGLHPLERKVLPYLSVCKSLKEIQEKSKLQEIEVSRALQWLENKNVVKIKRNNFELVEIGKNGKNWIYDERVYSVLAIKYINEINLRIRQ